MKDKNKRWGNLSKIKAPRKKGKKSKTNKGSNFIESLRNKLQEDVIQYIRVIVFFLVYFTLKWLVLKLNLIEEWDLAKIALFGEMIKNLIFSK